MVMDGPRENLQSSYTNLYLCGCAHQIRNFTSGHHLLTTNPFVHQLAESALAPQWNFR